MRIISNTLTKIVIIVTTLVIFFTIFTGCYSPISPKDVTPISKTALLLNTVVKITVYDKQDEALIADCFTLCEQYEQIFSRTSEESELYKLNKSGSAEVSDDLLCVIKLALSYCEKSKGAFDITVGVLSDMYAFGTESAAVPTTQEIDLQLSHIGYDNIEISGNTITLKDSQAKIDLGAIAKGYIADRLADFLKENGVTSAIIDLGGNVLCIGSKPGGSDYLVGIQYPFEDKSHIITTVSVSDMSVVTSGIYERYFEQDGVLYHHILNPKTGYPFDSSLLSVTIFAESSAVADGLSTVCFALGKDAGMQLIDDTEGVYAIFVTDDFKVHYSKDFENSFLQT